jgi:hypothetical protein
MLNEFEEMNNITSLLASVLNFPAMKGIPEDVTVAVRAAKKQMEQLPQVIEDLNLAHQRFTVLDKTIGRMRELAAIAADSKAYLSEGNREAMNEEFGTLAGVVASEAGQINFQGTKLSLLSEGKAKAAARVLAYLGPVLENMGHELNGQKSLILEAIVETANFLGIIAACYPEAKGIDELKRTLESLNLPKNINDPVLVNPTLH